MADNLVNGGPYGTLTTGIIDINMNTPGDQIRIGSVDIVKPRPGDLIRADFINQILEVLISLDARISALETETVTGVVITRLDPAGPLRIGDRLRVIGKNFKYPPVNNTVFIDSVRITQFRYESTSTQLVFDIPDVPGIPQAGKYVSLGVSNDKGSASASFLLMPALSYPVGRLVLEYTMPPVVEMNPLTGIGVITPGFYIFGFRLTAFVDREATCRLETSMNTTGWISVMLSSNVPPYTPVSGPLIITVPGSAIGASVQRDIWVLVNVPNQPNGTSARLGMSAVETSGGGMVTPANAPPLQITIGSEPPVPDNRVQVSLRSVAPADVQIVGNTVQFPRDVQGGIRFNVIFRYAGLYNISASLENPSGWADIDEYSISTPQINAAENGVADPAVTLTPGTGAGSTNLYLTIECDDPQISVTYLQPVAVIGT